MLRRDHTEALQEGGKVIQSLIVVIWSELKFDERFGEVVHGKVESSVESERGDS